MTIQQNQATILVLLKYNNKNILISPSNKNSSQIQYKVDRKCYRSKGPNKINYSFYIERNIETFLAKCIKYLIKFEVGSFIKKTECETYQTS